MPRKKGDCRELDYSATSLVLTTFAQMTIFSSVHRESISMSAKTIQAWLRIDRRASLSRGTISNGLKIYLISTSEALGTVMLPRTRLSWQSVKAFTDTARKVSV